MVSVGGELVGGGSWLDEGLSVQEGMGAVVVVGCYCDYGETFDAMHDVDCALVDLVFVEASADAGGIT